MSIRISRPSWTALVAAAALLSAAGCTNDTHPVASNGPGLRPSSSSASVGPTDTDSSPEQRRAGRTKPLELGALNKPPSAKDVNAPFDPCAVGWDVFPPGVRPDTPGQHAPRLTKPDGPQWTTECEYDNSGPIKVDANGGGSSGPDGGYLIISVMWAKDGKADPTQDPGAQPKTWGGKSGFLLSQPDDPQLGQLCMSSVKLSTGSGVTIVANSRFKDKASACDIASAGAAAIASISH